MAVMVMIVVIMVMMLVMFLIMVLIMMLVGIRRMFSITLETVLVPPVPIMSPNVHPQTEARSKPSTDNRRLRANTTRC
jgi:hypothetical protein